MSKFNVDAPRTTLPFCDEHVRHCYIQLRSGRLEANLIVDLSTRQWEYRVIRESLTRDIITPIDGANGHFG